MMKVCRKKTFSLKTSTTVLVKRKMQVLEDIHLSNSFPVLIFNWNRCAKKNNSFYNFSCRKSEVQWCHPLGSGHFDKSDRQWLPLCSVSAKTWRHLNITRAPSEKPISVTGLKDSWKVENTNWVDSTSTRHCHHNNFKQVITRLPVPM